MFGSKCLWRSLLFSLGPFGPSAKIALMLLKAYTGFSDRQLVEHLNRNIHYQMFCGIMRATCVFLRTWNSFGKASNGSTGIYAGIAGISGHKASVQQIPGMWRNSICPTARKERGELQGQKCLSAVWSSFLKSSSVKGMGSIASTVLYSDIHRITISVFPSLERCLYKKRKC